MANMRIASVVVDLVANSARYVAGLREANRDTRRYTRQMQRSFSDLSRNIAGMAAGYLGVSAAINQFNTSLQHAKEIEILSKMAGQSVEEFQAAAYATNQYGISAEQLGDISKDVNDKLGEFIATGGGAFKDFFENVAPEVGLTVEQLKHLSGSVNGLKNLPGSDILLQMKKAMEEANIPMEQQIFYLEAIANDASKLIPLLENNGEAWRKLEQDARNAGIVLSEVDIKALKDSEIVINRVSSQISTSFAQGVAGAAKQIEWLGKVTSATLMYIGAKLDAWSDNPKTLNGIIEKGTQLQEELDRITASIDLLEKNPGSYNRASRLAALNAQAFALQKEIKSLGEKRWAMTANLKIPEQPKLPEIKLGGDTGDAKKTADDIIRENQRIAASLSQTLLSRKKQLEISYKEEQQQIRDLVLSNEETRKLGFANIDALEKAWLKQSTDNYKKAQNELNAGALNKQQQLANSLRQSLSTEQELLKHSYDQQKQQIRSLVLNDVQVRAMGFQSLEALQKDWLSRSKDNYDQAVADLKESTKQEVAVIGDTTKKLVDLIGGTEDEVERMSEIMANVAENFAHGFSTELANMVTRGKADFASLAESIINQILQITIQAKLVNPLLQSMGILPTPAKATGGPVMRGQTYLVGEKGPELFTASNSGNIVANNKLGNNTQVNIYTQPGETAETRTRQTEQGDIIEVFMKQVDSRMNEQISRGQGLARTLEGRYALSRKSY